MSLVESALKYKQNLDADTVSRLKRLESWDFSYFIDEMNPRLMLSEGRVFSVEQLIPLLLHFAQTDPEIKKIAQLALHRWLGEQPYKQQVAELDPDYIDFACHKIRGLVTQVSEEFRKFVAISMIEPNQVHAPSGPIDMFWHFMLLHTVDYAKFCDEVWGGNPFDDHMAA